MAGFLFNLFCLMLKFKPLNRDGNEGFKGGLNFNVQHLRKMKGMASSNLQYAQFCFKGKIFI